MEKFHKVNGFVRIEKIMIKLFYHLKNNKLKNINKNHEIKKLNKCLKIQFPLLKQLIFLSIIFNYYRNK